MTLAAPDHPAAPAALQRSLATHTVAGLIGFAALFGGVGAWSWVTDVSGAVVAAGQLVVDSSVKKVQHPTGGVVGEIRVRDGDPVRVLFQRRHLRRHEPHTQRGGTLGECGL